MVLFYDLSNLELNEQKIQIHTEDNSRIGFSAGLKAAQKSILELSSVYYEIF